jgi:hypothetical protein
MSAVTINNEQHLFVIPSGDGYSCMGFDVVYKQLCVIREKITEKKLNIKSIFSSDSLEAFEESKIGTIEQYNAYKNAFSNLAKTGLKLGTWFSFDTPKKVRRILEEYRLSNDKIRIFYGDNETGRDWMKENDVMGTIGRSTGTMQIPLLISDDEHSGPGLLDSSIVRIIDVATKKELYRHSKYHQPEIEIIASSEKGYSHSVTIKKEVHGNFRTIGGAAGYVAFLTGDSMQQPGC